MSGAVASGVAATAEAPARAAGAARRPKVLLIGPTPPPYHGTATWTRMLLESAELRAGWDVVHLDVTDRRTMANMGRLDLRNVTLALRHARELAGLVRRERPDVVYVLLSQNAWAYLRDAVLMALARVLGCRVATHLHGSAFAEFYRGSNAACRALIRATGRWMGAAAVLGGGLRGLFEGMVPAERVRVAPVGIADPFPSGPPTRDGRAAGAPFTVLYLGMLYRPKGVLELLQAAARLGAGYRFLLAGPWYSEEDRAAIEGFIAEQGLSARVELRGVVDGGAKLALLGEADLLVFPGWQPEGLPLVVLEAMAAGLPVVATPMGALPDVLADGAGVLVPPRDAGALADAIARLAGDGAERARLARAGRERFEQRFTAARAVEALVSLLEHARA